MADINLLPWRPQKAAQRKRRLYCLGWLMLLALIFLLRYSYATRQNPLNQTDHSTTLLKQRQAYEKQLSTINSKLKEASLDSLHYTGFVKNGDIEWALVNQSNGLVSVILPNDYISKEHARVVSIQNHHLEIETIQWDQNGPKKKYIILSLS